jgi:hypothetical protein
MLCAARGLLPGQQTWDEMRFASAPKSLPVAEVNFEVRGQYFSVPDVFHLEVCLLNEICKNREAMFAVNEGDSFECVLDEARFRGLQALLMRLHAS